MDCPANPELRKRPYIHLDSVSKMLYTYIIDKFIRGRSGIDCMKTDE